MCCVFDSKIEAELDAGCCVFDSKIETELDAECCVFDSKIEEELEVEDSKADILAKEQHFNENCCMRCFSRFFFIFNAKVSDRHKLAIAVANIVRDNIQSRVWVS